MRQPSSAGRVHGVTTESGSTTIAEALQDIPTAADDVSGGNFGFVQAVAREQGSVVLQANLSRCQQASKRFYSTGEREGQVCLLSAECILGSGCKDGEGGVNT